MEKISLNVTRLKIQENLIDDYDEYFLNIEDYIKAISKITIYVFLICIAFYKSLILFILLIPFILIYPFFTKTELIKMRKNKLLLEFKDFLRILKSFLEASYSVENSFYLSIKELMMLHGKNAMIVKELKSMVMKLKLNKSIDVVFNEFAEKTKIEDIMDFSEVFIIAKKNGGNITKIISNTINVINDKIEVKLAIDTITASKRFEQKLMNLLPFLIIIYMNFSSSKFLSPLYTSIRGRVLMTFALSVYFMSVKISKKILDIEV